MIYSLHARRVYQRLQVLELASKNISLQSFVVLLCVINCKCWTRPGAWLYLKVKHKISLNYLFQGPPSQSKFQLLVKEQGSHFTEEVKFDTKSQTIVYKVPSHRNIDRAEILSDYVLVCNYPAIVHNSAPFL